MIRRGVLASALFVASVDLLGAQTGTQPSTGSPVSVERVRAGLQRPTRRWLPPEVAPADFRTEVVEDAWPLETILEAVRRELAADVVVKRPIIVGTAPPLVSVDLLQIASLVKNKLSAAGRARAERNARRKVQEALAEFCETHDCSMNDDPPGSTVEGVLP